MFKPKFRTLCVGGGALLLGAVAITGNPQSAPEIIASAVVNAPIVRIASPFDGHVEHAPPSRGTVVHPGDVLVRVKATQQGGQYLADLQARLTSTQRQLTATNSHIKALSDARTELQTRMENYRKGAIARLTAQLSEAEALHNIFKAKLAQSGDALDRQQQLKTKGYASQANFDAASATAIVAKNDVAASAARIQRIRVELESAKNGVFIGDNRDDVPYSQQRDDDIMLRLVELNATAKNLQASAKELQGQVAAEAKRMAADEVYLQHSLVTGVVWDSTSPNGSPVRAGDTLVNVLDCGRAFLEVHLGEAQANGIKQGDTAKIRLPGEKRLIDGTVRALRGSVAHSASDERTAESEPGTPGQMTIMVDLPATTTDNRSMENFCHVGRVAEVVFGGGPSPVASLAASRSKAPAPVPVAAR